MPTEYRQPFSFFKLVRLILRGERRFYWTATIYGIAISLLTLALPISVQILIEAIANTALVRSVVILSIALFILLALSGVFVALQTYVLEVFERRFLGRITAEITMRLTHSDTAQFDQMNADDLTNRFFEIDIVQKSLPVLLSGGLALVLQTLVGYIVVSSYHPVFFAFSLTHVLLLYLVWRVTHRGAVRTALDLSKAKYDTASWLELLVRHHRDFKSRRGIRFAARESDKVTKQYIDAHKGHFRYSFAQTIGFLALFAIASAALLGIGGWLVILGQLTLGQLVAAELILGAIFAGLSRFSYYLEVYYHTHVALYKLAGFFELLLEDPSRHHAVHQWSPTVRFNHAEITFPAKTYVIDAEFSAGSSTLVAPENVGLANVFIDMLTRMRTPEQGHILLGEHDLADFNAHELRENVFVIAGGHAYESTITEYLRFANPELSLASIRELLDVVSLGHIVSDLETKLDTVLATNGFPLTYAEVIRLKIARALAAAPRVLIFSSDCDVLRPEHRQRIFDYIDQLENTTFIYLSYRLDMEGFDNYLALESGRTEAFSTLAELIAFTRREHSSPFAKLDVASTTTDG